MRDAASRLLSTLKVYRKPCPDGPQAIESLEQVIRAAQSEGIGEARRRGTAPRAATIAAALALNAGCFPTVAAAARRFNIGGNQNSVSRLADRLTARAYLWETEDGGNCESSAPASSATTVGLTTCSGVSPSPPLPSCLSPSPPPAEPTAPRPRMLARVQALWARMRGTTPVSHSPCEHTGATMLDVGAGDVLGGDVVPHCPVCSQPPLSDAEFWADHSGTDLASCPTCVACRLPRIPTGWGDLVEQINERHAHQELGDGAFDNGTVGVPRPHELALWYGTSDDDVRRMAKLLRERQSKCTPWEKIVGTSSDADALVSRPRDRPLQVVCTCCNKSRNFDYLFGALKRIEHNKENGRGGKYMQSPSVIDFNKRIVDLVLETLALTLTLTLTLALALTPT